MSWAGRPSPSTGFDEATGKGTLVSVNSALDAFESAEMYGEILGATAKAMYERAGRG